MSMTFISRYEQLQTFSSLMNEAFQASSTLSNKVLLQLKLKPSAFCFIGNRTRETPLPTIQELDTREEE